MHSDFFFANFLILLPLYCPFRLDGWKRECYNRFDRLKSCCAHWAAGSCFRIQVAPCFFIAGVCRFTISCVMNSSTLMCVWLFMLACWPHAVSEYSYAVQKTVCFRAVFSCVHKEMEKTREFERTMKGGYTDA